MEGDPRMRSSQARTSGVLWVLTLSRTTWSSARIGPLDAPEEGEEVGPALEDAHGLSTSVAMCAGLVVDLAGPGFVAELDHRDAVDGGVEASVAAA